MRFTTGRSTASECPVSCSYSAELRKGRYRAAAHRISRRSSRPSRQPSGGGFAVCAQQEAARETKRQAKAERPLEIAGRPVADNTLYEMPVVWKPLPTPGNSPYLPQHISRAELSTTMCFVANGLRADLAEGIHSRGHRPALWRVWYVPFAEPLCPVHSSPGPCRLSRRVFTPPKALVAAMAAESLSKADPDPECRLQRLYVSGLHMLGREDTSCACQKVCFNCARTGTVTIDTFGIVLAPETSVEHCMPLSWSSCPCYE